MDSSGDQGARYRGIKAQGAERLEGFLALAEEGANVAITYVNSADKAATVVRQLEAKGVTAAAFQTDQGDPSKSELLIQDVVKRFGRLDILVNNAIRGSRQNCGQAGDTFTTVDRCIGLNSTASSSGRWRSISERWAQFRQEIARCGWLSTSLAEGWLMN